jgi:hypothetical protein
MIDQLKHRASLWAVGLLTCAIALTASTAFAAPAMASVCQDCGDGGGGDVGGGGDDGTGDGSGGGGSGGGGSTHVYHFVPIRITTNDITDGWPDKHDEPSLYYGNNADKVTYKYITFAGDTKTDLPSASFTGTSISVDMWERDDDWADHDHLGTETATVAALGQEEELNFAGGPGVGGSYKMVYKIIDG